MNKGRGSVVVARPDTAQAEASPDQLPAIFVDDHGCRSKGTEVSEVVESAVVETTVETTGVTTEMSAHGKGYRRHQGNGGCEQQYAHDLSFPVLGIMTNKHQTPENPAARSQGIEDGKTLF